MKYAVKLFEYGGTPVYLKFWFFILLFWLSPIYVLSIFISILIHELAHAYLAKRYDYKVDSIYIDIFNGAAMMDLDNMDRRDSRKIIMAGPLSNFALLSFCILFLSIGIKNDFLWSMTVANFFIFVFNIIPIFPLDGGRILRDTLIINTGDYEKSVRISATVSLILSSLLLIFYTINFSLLMIIFSIIFILFSARELNWIKLDQ